ncbi:MAG: alkane 1-monooxygenase [Rhodocyclaceae bacterium]|nr:alkane 1-monooxygenase [Rhodocyclaceae bacterium]
MMANASLELPYHDRKRWAWLFSLLVPGFVGLGPALYLWSGEPLVLWAPIAYNYFIVPVIDLLMGEDQSNPPESAVPMLDADPYYRYITYAAVPMMWLAFIFAAWFVATYPLPWHGVLAVILTTGGIGGFCINIGHELGHKVPHIERWLAKLVLAPTGYGHFTVEHNRGHHIEVATPEDSASSRMGESIYKFMLREVPGAWTRAWALETRRLSSLGLPAWSLKNEVIQPLLMTAVLWIALCLWLGFAVLPFILAASLWSNFQLTSANYIEHYGLLRAKDAKGNYEPCQPHHSWNSNHVFSNWAVFHLQRHSDHHAHPARRYQSLRHFEHLPELPNGYFGMFSAAYIPALWFRLMDQRLVDFVGGDARKINFDARQRERLIEKFKLTVA